MSLPTKMNERIQYVQAHIAPFTTNTVAIGLVTADVTSLGAIATAAQTAFELRESLRQQTEAATLDVNSKVDQMTLAWAACTDKIKGKAKQVGGTSVYTLAQIPAPATPGPVPAPGEPTNFAVTLENNGAVTLTWKCANPAGSSGTTYQVWRRLAATGDLAFIGVSGQKKFVDSTIPAGTTQATYQIQAFRSTMAGPWAQFNVNFTTEIGGAVVAAVAGAAPKIAA